MTLEMLTDHADYIAFGLVSAILLMPRARFVRFFVALYAGILLARALMTDRDQTVIIWMSVLLGIALLLLIVDIFWGSRARLSREEQAMASTLLHRVNRGRARHFIDQGFWLNGRAGDVLIKEGEPVRHLYFLSDGEARVSMAGKQVGFCRSGQLVGEFTLFTHETASATVILAGPARFWCAPVERLEPYLRVHESLRRAIQNNVASGTASAAAEEEMAPAGPSGAMAAT
jgi:CRP-like cAMP-binding protein